MRLALLLGAAPLLAADLPVAPRTPTLSGSLDESFLLGSVTPATANADQDGLQESWTLFAGLPLDVDLGYADGPFRASAQGNAWAGPSLADSFSLEREAGLGGQPWLRLHQASALPDTPSTRILFWRGAVGAYRFGLDLERRLGSTVGLRVATQSRAYPARRWKYRDQTNSMYLSSSRTLKDLPSQGTTPGLDEMRWEIALSAPLPGGALEGGWRWTDASRGWIEPSADTTSLAPNGSESRQEAFLSGSTRLGSVKLDGGASLAGLDLARPQWSLDSSTASDARFRGTQAQGRLQADWIGNGWSAGPRFANLWQDGTVDGSAPWNADLRRYGAGLRAGGALGPHLLASAGWTDGNVRNRDLGLEDWSAKAGWTHRLVALEAGTSRWHRIPLLTESVLGEVQNRWLPSADLGAERTDLHELSARLSPWSFVALDGGLALLSLDDRIAPHGLGDFSHTDSGALVLSNLEGSSQGTGIRAGLRLSAGGWTLRSETSFSRMKTSEGKTDLSLPRMWTRSFLDWQGKVLADHMLLEARLGVKTRSEAWAWISTKDGNAKRVRLPPAALADLETRFEIGRFGLYWNLQNLGNQVVKPAPGWSALGVRSGFGIHWSLAG